jgi:hypothetical protein
MAAASTSVPMSFVRTFMSSPSVSIARCDLTGRRIGGGGKVGPNAE